MEILSGKEENERKKMFQLPKVPNHFDILVIFSCIDFYFCVVYPCAVLREREEGEDRAWELGG